MGVDGAHREHQLLAGRRVGRAATDQQRDAQLRVGELLRERRRGLARRPEQRARAGRPGTGAEPLEGGERLVDAGDPRVAARVLDQRQPRAGGLERGAEGHRRGDRSGDRPLAQQRRTARGDRGRPGTARRRRVLGHFAHDLGGFGTAARGEQRLDVVAVVPDDARLGDAAALADLEDLAELRDGRGRVAPGQRRRAQCGPRERGDAPQAELLGGAQREVRALRALRGVAEMGEDVRRDGVPERGAALFARFVERDVDGGAGQRVEPAAAPVFELGEQRVRERLDRGEAAARRSGNPRAQRVLRLLPAVAHQQHVAGDLHQLDPLFGNVVAGRGAQCFHQPDRIRVGAVAAVDGRIAPQRLRDDALDLVAGGLLRALAHVEAERHVGGEQRRGGGGREHRELESGQSAAHAIRFRAKRDGRASGVLGEGADLVAQQHRLGALAFVR